MSISRTVYVNSANVPAPIAWAEAIRAAGFELAIDTDFEMDEHTGFLPCEYRGKPTGFEYFSSTVADLAAADEDYEPPNVGDRDIAIAFVTRSSMAGLVAAAIAAAVLCERADGIVQDDESGDLIAAKDAVADARELEASLRAELE